MAVSDTLSEAVDEIRDYLDTNPGMYRAVRPRIEALLAEMEQVRVLLDTPPLSDPGG
tara:strand:+ start:1853 stop:2023 length:171 start_codon:yes stop_codon:yes gene_type:complete